METKSYTTIDRTALSWPSGEWDGEPDKVQWEDAETKAPCLAVRNPRIGHWCGYVGVPPAHPMHGKNYDDADVDVHGGLTFSDACRPHADESHGICHVPGEGEEHNVWWFGFDCAHAGDTSPNACKMAADLGYPFTIHPGERYRTLAYVQHECAQLAKQLADQPNA